MRCKSILIVAMLLLLLPMSFSVSAQSEPFVAGMASTAPVLDGKLAAGEWGQALYTVQPSDENAYVQRYNGQVELPADMQVYMMWDEEFLYVAAAVRQAQHVNVQSAPADAWDGHALLLTLQGSKGQDRLSLALGADGEILCGTHPRGNKGDVDAASGAHTGAVSHADGVTVYEMQVRRSELIYSKVEGEISFSVAAHLADAERKTYGGTFMYAAAQGDGLTLPTVRFDAAPANADFDPNATTTTTQTEGTQTTTATVPSKGFALPDAHFMKWVLLGCLGGAALLLTVVLIVVICRRK